MKIEDVYNVPVVTGLCLIALVVILKNVLNVPAEILSRDVIIYIAGYSGMAIFAKEDKTKVWSAVVILTTAAIIAFYALF